MDYPSEMMSDNQKIESWFTYHPPQEGDKEKFIAIREQAKELALTIIRCCTPCADRTAALRKVREAMMTANAAIACRGA